MNAVRQFCTFYIGDRFFGVDVLQVREVIRYQEMTRVPHSSGAVSGLINLRGQTVTAIDIRQRLGLEGSHTDEPMNVVIRAEGGAVSLLVDDIGDVIEPDEACFEEPPETLTGATQEMILGVYKLKDSLMLVLDTEKAIDFDASVI